MSLILCIETGTDVCSAALAKNGKMISLRESSGSNDHARNIGVYVDEMLNENDIKPSELDAVAIGKGPGSYTGLRIGVSFAKGICYALGIPLIAVDSLEALTRCAVEDYELGLFDAENWDNALLCPMIDARRMEVYEEIFDTRMMRVAEVDAKVINEDSFAELLADGKEFFIFGSGAAKCVDVLKGNVKKIDVLPSARGLCATAQQRLDEGQTEDIAYFEPFYLKDFVVTKSKKNLLDVGGRKTK